MVEYLAQGKRGSADLCAYFFLRASQLTSQGGQCGLLATNTIAQGDTREVGLDQILTEGWMILRAVPSRRWPGEAGLEVAHIWLRRGNWHGQCLLDEKPVEGITPFLTAQGKMQGKPYILLTNANQSFMGTVVLGKGFVLKPEDAYALIAKAPRNKDVLFPYLNGRDLNSRPDQSPSRWIINFHDWPLERAETYQDCINIVQEKVKPERSKSNRKIYRDKWWQYAEKCLTLYNTIDGMNRVLVVGQTSKYHSFIFVPVEMVYDQKLLVFTVQKYGCFAQLQSLLHAEWVLTFGSTLETRPVYTPTDCFETYPFLEATDNLDVIGERYYQHRQWLMKKRSEGLTDIYNRFHDLQETATDIVRLRVLHKEMDEAVAKAYGWDDVDLGHGFHETKQGLRYTISEAARREVLGRLLKLNHERYAEEETMGLHEKGAKKGKGKQATKGSKDRKSADENLDEQAISPAQETLFG